MRSLFLLLAIATASNIYSQSSCYRTVNSYQTIYTRNNTAVQGINYSPISGQCYSDALSYIQGAYPNATILEYPTGEYNCYSYAFHLSEGNTSKVWVNPQTIAFAPNLSNYWTDGSFIEVCNESDGDKAYYYLGDHAALTTSSIGGQYESKWGLNCRVIHAPTYCPYDVPYFRRKYYASTKMTGAVTNLCTGSRVFSVKNISGATYTWTYSSSLSPIGATNTNQVTVERNGSSNGAAWVEVQISTPCSGTTATTRLNFSVGAPPPVDYILINGGSSDPMSLCPNSYYAAIANPTIYTQYEWYLPNGWNVSNANSGPNPWVCWDYELDFQTDGYNSGTMAVRRVNECGASDLLYMETTLNCGGYYYYKISPNPAKDLVTIDGRAKNRQIKEIQLIDKMGIAKKLTKYPGDTKFVTFNISGLPTGIYILKIYDGKDWVAKPLSIQ